MKESKHLGKKYNFLFVKGTFRKDGRQYAQCVCDCGATKDIILYNVTNGHTKSCGCKQGALISKELSKPKTHGYGGTRIYHTWHGMIDRCNNSKCKAFKDYGGRGIKVCDEWLDINTFVEWANENGYTDKLTIDRIDVNGNYESSNCRWATQSIQANNKRTSVYVEYGGEKLTLTQWSNRLGGKPNLVRHRILIYGWDEIKAITTPVVEKEYKITDEQVREIYNLKKSGQMQTMALSKKYNVSEDTIRCIMRGTKRKSAFL
jgi:hypothetical protein